MSETDRLRAAYRKSVDGGEAAHLTEDQWERLACDELGEEETRQALDHILRCSLCSDTYRALGILRTGAADFDEAAPLSNPTPAPATVLRFPWRSLGVVAAAATVLLAVVIPLRQTLEAPPSDPAAVVRSNQNATTTILTEPLDRVAWKTGDDLLLAWDTGGAELLVSVEILDDLGDLVWSSSATTASHVTWPGEAIPGPGHYFWRTIRSTGSRLAGSDLVAFDLVIANPP